MPSITFEKLRDFFSKKNYEVTTVYISGTDGVRVLEVKTPKTKKIFTVYIPPNYTITDSTNIPEDINMREVYGTDEPISYQQIDFIDTISSAVTESVGVSVVSSDGLTLRFPDQNMIYFTFGSFPDDDENIIIQETGDEIDQLNNQLNTWLDPKIAQERKLATREKMVNGRLLTSKTGGYAIETDDPSVKGVALSFVDKNGEEIDDITYAIEHEDVGNGNSNESDYDVFEDMSDGECVAEGIVPSLRQRDIVIGVVYPLFDFKTFFAMVKKNNEKEKLDHESIVIKTSEDILVVENDMLDRKIAKIGELAGSVEGRITRKVEQHRSEVEEIKKNISRLTRVYLDSQATLAKNDVESERYAAVYEVKQEAERMINEYNIKLLKSRDSIQEVVVTYINIIRQLLSI